MAAVSTCSDFGAPQNKVCQFPLFPHLFAMKWWDWMSWSEFYECWIWSQLFQSPFSPSSRGSLVSLQFLPLEWYHLHIWGCWCFSHLSWFQLVTHPVWHFSWCAQHLVKQTGWQQTAYCTPFSILNHSVIPYRVLTYTVSTQDEVIPCNIIPEW